MVLLVCMWLFVNGNIRTDYPKQKMDFECNFYICLVNILGIIVKFTLKLLDSVRFVYDL